MSTAAFNYDFTAAVREWRRVPWDDYGYLDSEDVLNMDVPQFRELVRNTYAIRFDPYQWRNRRDSLLWFMDPMRWAGKRVLDFGCGFGADGITFGKCGAQVLLADINPSTLRVAQRSMQVMGFNPRALVVVTDHPPFFLHDCVQEGVDLFWSNGVLHHLPYMGRILESAVRLLRPGGECRVLLYSARRWREVTGTEPPEDTHSSKAFSKFVRLDAVGTYSDWYDEDKLNKVVGEFANVVSCQDLFDGQLIGAVIKPKVPQK